MEEKKTEVRIKLSTKEKYFHADKTILIDYVVKKLKNLKRAESTNVPSLKLKFN